MAESVTVANAYVQIMPSAQGAKESITDAIMPAAESAGDSAGDAIGSGILGKIGELKGPLMAAGGAILGAIGVTEIASALMDIGGQFDDMVDAIIVGTGASGDALDSLTEAAESIATTVPVSFGDAGEIVADISSRMGLVGDDLEGVGSRVAALGELLGKSVNVDALTGSLNAFGIAGEDASGAMDYLWGVSQNTGIEFDKLTGILETNAPALQSLGFSFEEAANMAGMLDRAGLDASGTMGKMGKALVELAKPGESAEDAFQRVVGSIGDYIASGDEAAALDIASQVFGTKGATQFVAAVKSGSLSLEDLQDAALGAGEGIMGTLDATMDWPERWELIKNKSAEALQPLGGALMDGATAAMEELTRVIDEIDPAVFEELGVILGEVLSTAVDVLADAIDFLVSHKEEIGDFFSFWGQVIGTVVKAIGVILKSVTQFVQSSIKAFNDLKAKLSATWDTIKTKVSETWENIKTTITTTWENVKTAVSNAVDNVKTTVSNAWDSVKSTVTTKWDNIKSAVTGAWDNIKNAVSGAVDNVKSLVSNAWDNIKNTATNTWNNIKSAITGPIDTAKENVRNAIDAIKGFFSFNIQWPHIPLPHFTIYGSANPLDWLTQGVPQIYIQWYAKGGFVDEPTALSVAGERGGEFVWPSYEPYISRYADALVQAESKYQKGQAGVVVTGNTFIVRKESDIRAIGIAINRQAERERGAKL